MLNTSVDFTSNKVIVVWTVYFFYCNWEWLTIFVRCVELPIAYFILSISICRRNYIYVALEPFSIVNLGSLNFMALCLAQNTAYV